MSKGFIAVAVSRGGTQNPKLPAVHLGEEKLGILQQAQLVGRADCHMAARLVCYSSVSVRHLSAAHLKRWAFSRMQVVKGDLLEMAESGTFDVIVHGCNCQHTMGAGIAKQIKSRFPQAFEADLKTLKGAAKLGTISTVQVKIERRSLVIVNGYTQVHWRGSGVKVSYEAVRSVMRQVKKDFSGLRIGYPKIGAGLAGGDWERIEEIIDAELTGEQHWLVEYSPR